MAVGYKQLDVLLTKVQSALGTKQTSLTILDSTVVMDGFSMDFNQEFTPIDFATGTLGQQASVKGVASVDIKVDMPLIPTGSTTACTADQFLQCSGMGVVTASNLKTYTPSSDTTGTWKDLTLWSYSGEKTAAQALLTTAHSGMFDFALKGELGKPCMISFTGKAATDGTVVSASYPVGAVTIPSMTIPATIKATTMTVGDRSLKVLDFEISMGNTLALIKDMSAAYGYSGCTITKRESKWKARGYAQSAATLSPYTIMDGPTLGDFTLTFGPTIGSRITVASGTDKCQVTSVKNADEDGIKIWEMEGLFVDNDWSLAVNVT
jgi:hypothetical protein